MLKVVPQDIVATDHQFTPAPTAKMTRHRDDTPPTGQRLRDFMDELGIKTKIQFEWHDKISRVLLDRRTSMTHITCQAEPWVAQLIIGLLAPDLPDYEFVERISIKM
jgi:hypothetical protein